MRSPLLSLVVSLVLVVLPGCFLAHGEEADPSSTLEDTVSLTVGVRHDFPSRAEAIEVTIPDAEVDRRLEVDDDGGDLEVQIEGLAPAEGRLVEVVLLLEDGRLPSRIARIEHLEDASLTFLIARDCPGDRCREDE